MAIPGYRIVGPDGQASAEFDSDALVWYARQGQIQPQSMVFDPTLGQWLAAGSIGALQGAFVVPMAHGAQPYGGAFSQSSGSVVSPLASRGVIAAVVLGIAIVVGLIIVGSARLMTGRQTVASPDGLYSIKVPLMWHHLAGKAANVNEYVSGVGQGVFVIRVSHHAAIPGELDEQTTRIANLSMRLYHVSQLAVKAVPTTVSGFPAEQFEIDHSDLSFGHRLRKTLISTPDGIYDVTIYTDINRGSSDRTDQDTILATFHHS